MQVFRSKETIQDRWGNQWAQKSYVNTNIRIVFCARWVATPVLQGLMEAYCAPRRTRAALAGFRLPNRLTLRLYRLSVLLIVWEFIVYTTWRLTHTQRHDSTPLQAVRALRVHVALELVARVAGHVTAWAPRLAQRTDCPDARANLQLRALAHYTHSLYFRANRKRRIVEVKLG